MDNFSQSRNSYPGWSHGNHLIRSAYMNTTRGIFRHSLHDTRDITDSQRGNAKQESQIFSLATTPLEDKRSFKGILTTPSFATDVTLVEPVQSVNIRTGRLRGIGWRISLVVLPIALLSALLLAIVFGLRFKSEPSLFPIDLAIGGSRAPILVNYSATRITFVTSLLSMLASLLGGVIMRLWSLYTAKSLTQAAGKADATQDPPKLQDADEYRSLVGMFLASPEELFNYLARCSKKRPSTPAILHKAAIILALSLALSFSLFVVSTILQNVANSVNVEMITTHSQPTSSFGRGLSEFCLSFDRMDNQGFPCTNVVTINSHAENAMITVATNEVSYLAHNISHTSEIRLIPATDAEHNNAAILIPQVQTIPSKMDFRAPTIGVAMQCRPITSKCNMTPTGPDGSNTHFNCTENFYGVLGKPPNVTTIAQPKAEDPDLPPMSYKPATTLQYGFFSDADLTTVYNTGSYDLATGSFDPTVSTLPDSSLINPVFVAVAGRIPATPDRPVGPSDHGFWQGGWEYIDFILSCSYATYDVEYSWVNGSILDTEFKSSPNGSLAEMYHGLNWLWSSAQGAPMLQDNIQRAGLEATSQSLADTWADLYSVQVLAQIGAYTTPRTNLLEQQRTDVLVTEIPKLPLGFLLGLSLVYVVLGIALGSIAYRAACSEEVVKLAEELSFGKVVETAYHARGEKGFGVVDKGTGKGVAEKVGVAVSVAGDAGDEEKGGSRGA